jgi:hypothetical protein
MLLGFLVLILLGTFALTGQANPALEWLNGKWTARPSAGGELRIAATAGRDHQVEASAIVPEGEKEDAASRATGTAKEDPAPKDNDKIFENVDQDSARAPRSSCGWKPRRIVTPCDW